MNSASGPGAATSPLPATRDFDPNPSGPPNRGPNAALIDRRVYTDHEVFDRERSHLFQRVWSMVGHESDLADRGAYRAVTVAGEPVVVVRDDSGALRAFLNSCTHRGAMLVRNGGGNCGSKLRCLYHGWTFDLSGQCVAVPYKRAYGSEFDTSVMSLPAVRVETHAGLVFVNLDDDAPSLESFLEPVRPYVDTMCGGMDRVIGRYQYRYHGNWKLWHENFTDGYHPEFTHRVVHDAEATYATALGGKGENTHLGLGHTVLTWAIEPPNLARLEEQMGKYSGLDHHVAENPSRRAREIPGSPWEQHTIFTVFPNLDFQDGFSTPCIEVLHPEAPDQTLVEVVFLGSSRDTDEVARLRLQNVATAQTSAGKIAADDNEAVQRCQAGFAARQIRFSDMSRGGAAGLTGHTKDEHGLRGFYEEWRRYVFGSARLDGELERIE